MFLEGYIYQRSRLAEGRAYWVCRKYYRKECNARAVTSDPALGAVTIFKGPADSPHAHPPNTDETMAEELTRRIKRKAEAHPEQPPSQLLRTELQGVSEEVLSQLPSQPSLVRTVQRVRRTDLPAAPTKRWHLKEIPDRYKKTLLDEQFLLHDSGPPVEDSSDEYSDSDSEEEHDEVVQPRVIVFATRKNIELLCHSATWFLDGTFKTAPSIFAQLFTIMGLRARAGHPEDIVAVPLVYAFLSGKTTELYREVLEAVKAAVDRFNITPCVPTKIMCDFELAILNACEMVFPGVPRSGCYFHLGQIIYRRVQAAGLQEQYRDPVDRSVKRFTHMLLALAFVPEDDVSTAFTELRRECPAELLGVYDDFQENYITGRPARGRRRGTRPRYPISLWNQFATALDKSYRTNNVSEGWHNRFRLVVGKHHPDIYTAIAEIQKEQGFTEICISELSMGKKVKAAPAKKWHDLQRRLESIAAEYQTKPLLEYLRTIAANVDIS